MKDSSSGAAFCCGNFRYQVLHRPGESVLCVVAQNNNVNNVYKDKSLHHCFATVGRSEDARGKSEDQVLTIHHHCGDEE